VPVISCPWLVGAHIAHGGEGWERTGERRCVAGTRVYLGYTGRGDGCQSFKIVCGWLEFEQKLSLKFGSPSEEGSGFTAAEIGNILAVCAYEAGLAKHEHNLPMAGEYGE
jgi:hypothetical protein